MNFDIDASVHKLIDNGPALLMMYGTKVVMAIIIFFVGKWLAKAIANVIQKAMNARGVDVTISKFTKNIVYYAVCVVVIVAALGQLGIQTASFVAIIGAAGLAVGLALQGSLSNFASGVLMILFRPIRVGDYVEAGGTAGTVNEISIFNTIFKTPDNKTVIVSNSDIMGGVITNYSMESTRRVEIKVGVSYSSSIPKVKEALKVIAEEEERILKDKDITIAVSELADSAVVFVFRVWVNKADFWPVTFDLNEKIKIRFDEKGIAIPFPQMDIHVDMLEKMPAANAE